MRKGSALADVRADRLYASDLPPLDGVRGIAALLVVGFHGAFNWIPGRVGVLIFFVLSGFLITRLLLREQTRTGTVSLSRFYWRRSLRIFPAFYVFAAVYAFFSAPIDRGGFTAALLYGSNYWFYWHPDRVGLAHTWSLSVEEQFYLLWPWICLWGVRRAHFLRELCIAIGLIALWKVVWIDGFNHDFIYAYMAFDTRSGDLLVGCALAVWLQRRPSLPLWIGRPAALVAPLSVLLLASALDALGADAWNLAYVYTPAAVATALLLVQLIVLQDHPTVAWLSTKPLRAVGAISYPIYLYHVLVIRGVNQFAFTHYSVRVLAIIGASLLVATLSRIGVERPCLRLRDVAWIRTLTDAAMVERTVSTEKEIEAVHSQRRYRFRPL